MANLGVFEDAIRRQNEKFAQIKKEDEIIEELQRASGRTTRRVDAAIQEFFKKGEVTLVDHHEGGTNARMNAYLAERFETRMRREHPQVKMIFNNINGVHTAKISKK